MDIPLSSVLSAYPYRTLKKKAGSIVLTKPSCSDRKSQSFRLSHRPRLLKMQQTVATVKHYCLNFHIIKAFRSEGDPFARTGCTERLQPATFIWIPGHITIWQTKTSGVNQRHLQLRQSA